MDLALEGTGIHPRTKSSSFASYLVVLSGAANPSYRFLSEATRRGMGWRDDAAKPETLWSRSLCYNLFAKNKKGP